MIEAARALCLRHQLNSHFYISVRAWNSRSKWQVLNSLTRNWWSSYGISFLLWLLYVIVWWALFELRLVSFHLTTAARIMSTPSSIRSIFRGLILYHRHIDWIYYTCDRVLLCMSFRLSILFLFHLLCPELQWCNLKVLFKDLNHLL